MAGFDLTKYVFRYRIQKLDYLYLYILYSHIFASRLGGYSPAAFVNDRQCSQVEPR